MQTRIQKWGNSLGVRIPKAIAEQAGVQAGSGVELSVKDGNLIIRPQRRRRYELKTLLRRVTTRNIHKEIETGEPVGREVW